MEKTNQTSKIGLKCSIYREDEACLIKIRVINNIEKRKHRFLASLKRPLNVSIYRNKKTRGKRGGEGGRQEFLLRRKENPLQKKKRRRKENQKISLSFTFVLCGPRSGAQ